MNRTVCTLMALSLVAGPLAAQAAAEAPKVVTKTTIDIGYVNAAGNSELSTTNVGETLTQTRGLWTLGQRFSFVQSQQDGSETANYLGAGLRADYKLDKIFSLFVDAGYERNQFAGIARRFAEQAGLNARVLAATRDTAHVSLGGSMVQELSTDEVEQRFPAANLIAGWRHTFTPLAYFNQAVNITPNLKETEDLRVTSESALVAPISSNVALKLTYTVRYDRQPAEDFKTTDRIFTSGVQIVFE